MEKIFSPGIIYNFLGAILGFVIVVYSTKLSLSFLRREFVEGKRDVKAEFDKINNMIATLHSNQIKNCNDIKHISDRMEKLEDKCDRRHE